MIPPGAECEYSGEQRRGGTLLTLDTDSDGCWIIRLETRQHTYLTLETQQKTVIIAPKTLHRVPSARPLRSPVLICVCISCGGARPAARLKPCAGSREGRGINPDIPPSATHWSGYLASLLPHKHADNAPTTKKQRSAFIWSTSSSFEAVLIFSFW